MAENPPKKRHTLVNDPIPATLIRMTGPMIIGMLMLFTFNLVDTLFISMLGTEPLSAISFTFPVTFMVLSLAIGLGIGTSAVVAKYLGCDECEKAKQASTVTNYTSIALALALSLVAYLFMDPIFRLMGASEALLPQIRAYMSIWLPTSALLVGMNSANSVLRACGDTKTPSLLMAAAGLINAVLDPIFIFGLGPVPAMGIQGAALATLVSWVVGFGYLFYYLIVKVELVYPGLPSRAVIISSSREMLRIGIPAAGANMMTPVAAGIMTAIAATYGETTVAAFGVGSRLESIASLIVLALSSTLPPFISQNLGAGRTDRIADSYRLTMKFVLIWQLLIYGMMALSAQLIAAVFTEDPAVSRAIELFIWILPLGYGLQGVIILTNSAFNALHKPMMALYLSIARFFVFYVPMAWVGSQLFGLAGFYAGALLGNILMALLSWRSFERALKHNASPPASV
ncbi:MAG: MATE family efflux transporter [Pseudomonadales bacterium]|nr:MATE family efflux transporter [Pseudomonadales bacterium]